MTSEAVPATQTPGTQTSATQCSACGDCCDPVWYPLGAADIRQSASTTGSADLVFAAAHWHPTGARDDDGRHAYRCDRFDPDSRLCTAHDERPPICRGYPWYDDPPGRRLVVLPLRCAFRADQPDQLAQPAQPAQPRT